MRELALIRTTAVNLMGRRPLEATKTGKCSPILTKYTHSLFNQTSSKETTARTTTKPKTTYRSAVTRLGRCRKPTRSSGSALDSTTSPVQTRVGERPKSAIGATAPCSAQPATQFVARHKAAHSSERRGADRHPCEPSARSTLDSGGDTSRTGRQLTQSKTKVRGQPSTN